MRPKSVPYWVEQAELAMAQQFGINLWEMRPRHRTKILVAALDVENGGEFFIHAAVFDKWKFLQNDVLSKKGG